MPITIDSFGLTEEQKQNLVLVTPEQCQTEQFIQDGLVSPGYWLVNRKPSGRIIKELLCAGNFQVAETLVEEQVQTQPLVEVPVVESLVEVQAVEQLVETPVVETLVEAPVASQEASEVSTLTEGTTQEVQEPVEAPAKPARGRKKQQ